MHYHLIAEIAIKLFFLLTPFFVLSMFVTITQEMDAKVRFNIARRATFSIIFVCLILYFFGQLIFNVFGITLDAFRVGAGVILMLTSIELVRGHNDADSKNLSQTPGEAPNTDIAVVPLTIPYVVGPGTIGMLLVMGGDSAVSFSDRIFSAIGITIACACVGLMLCYSEYIIRILKHRGLQILSKITGLVLAAIAAQSFCTGIKHFFFGN